MALIMNIVELYLTVIMNIECGVFYNCINVLSFSVTVIMNIMDFSETNCIYEYCGLL